MYSCFWLDGYLDEELRPDKAGFVMDLDRNVETGHVMHCVTEAWVGAFNDPQVLWRLKKLCKKLGEPIVANKTTMFVPNDRRWLEKVRKTFGEDAHITIV